jgi:hypothetical protein
VRALATVLQRPKDTITLATACRMEPGCGRAVSREPITPTDRQADMYCTGVWKHESRNWKCLWSGHFYHITTSLPYLRPPQSGIVGTDRSTGKHFLSLVQPRIAFVMLHARCTYKSSSVFIEISPLSTSFPLPQRRLWRQTDSSTPADIGEEEMLLSMSCLRFLRR